MSIADHEIEDRAEILPAAEGAAPGSLLDTLTRKRQELAEKGPREETRLVPLWEGAVRVTYRYPAGGADPIIRAAQRAAESGKRDETLNANMDVLINCCHRIEGRQPEGEWESLDPSGEPIRFTRKLADLLGIDVPAEVKNPARLVCRHLFSPKATLTGEFDGDLSLMRQAGQVINWLNGVEQAADEDLRGE